MQGEGCWGGCWSTVRRAGWHVALWEGLDSHPSGPWIPTPGCLPPQRWPFLEGGPPPNPREVT